MERMDRAGKTGEVMGWMLVRNSEDRMLQGPMLLQVRGKSEQLVSGSDRVTVFATSAKAHRVKQRAELDWLRAFNQQRRAGSPFSATDDYIEVVPLYPHTAATPSTRKDIDHDDGQHGNQGAADGAGATDRRARQSGAADAHAPAPRRDFRR